MAERLVITGMGVVSALGVGLEKNLAALRAGRCGIAPVRYLPTSLSALPAGEVPLSQEELQALCGVPDAWPRTALLSLLALREALSQAGLAPEGLSLISGTTVGGMDLTEKQWPAYSPYHSCGKATDLAADKLGLGGFRTTLSTACSSAANALIFGARLLQSGFCEHVVCGGSESLSDYHFHGFHSLMILDREPCRPFDASRAGLNLGEGAAYLVLETETSARRRGARLLAILDGWGNACDAFHQTASSENGEGAFLAMREALGRAGLEPADIDYVNAHGTGTPNNDASESAALRRVFGDALPPVSSTKAATGHTTSASGSIEAVFCILALLEGFIPPQLHFQTPDPACITPETQLRTARLRHVLCNAFGFGGNDTSLLFSAL